LASTLQTIHALGAGFRDASLADYYSDNAAALFERYTAMYFEAVVISTLGLLTASRLSIGESAACTSWVREDLLINDSLQQSISGISIKLYIDSGRHIVR